jgi:hypothetical protein
MAYYGFEHRYGANMWDQDGGRQVATCPAAYRDDVTCASCGLCQRQDRKLIVGFPAHGYSKGKARIAARAF